MRSPYVWRYMTKISTQAICRNLPARAVFEAMEQARVEALGGRHLSGLGDNLMAALDARALKRGFDKPEIAKDDLPKPSGYMRASN